MKHKNNNLKSNFLYTLLCHVFFNSKYSEYEKVHFRYNISSFIMSFIGIVFWLVILIFCSILIYVRINYPKKFKQLYDIPSRNQNSSYNSNRLNNDVYIIRDFFG